MIKIQEIKKSRNGILVIGNHCGIIQSVFDFDYLSGKEAPGVKAIVSSNRRALKLFWGRKEVLIPCFKSIADVPKHLAPEIEWMLNLSSGRRAREHTVSFFETFPDALGGHIFAENVPEKHAAELITRFGGKKLIAGPSGVGLLVPGYLKLGAIGGTDAEQIEKSALATTYGTLAVISTSGGMTNELIRAVANTGRGLSFSLSVGGDRFPVTSLTDTLMLAEQDPKTKAIVYFGELGGIDEYEIIELVKRKKLTKPVLAYISGIIDEAFDEHVQFGHAKALVARPNESARAKRNALKKAGISVPQTFHALERAIKRLPGARAKSEVAAPDTLVPRRASILSTRNVVDPEKTYDFVSKKKPLVRGEGAFAQAALEALLGREITSKTTAVFADAVFELLIDHGGNVSGAVNTMVAARAGKDLVSSLASGLLTIGPRFGGALNEAARTWRKGVALNMSAKAFVREETAGGKLLAGIGHKKYRMGLPDPRVEALSAFATLLKKHPHYDFARAVERVTTGKNGALILNIDGAIAALALDIFSECERMKSDEINELIEAEFFNALFVIPRSVGFIAHFMEQKTNDEGLFRLPDELLYIRKSAVRTQKQKTHSGKKRLSRRARGTGT